MNRNELKDYRNWLPASPQTVIDSVKAVGGWHHVFECHLPAWASKVRNFFNATPKSLRRFDEALSEKWLKRGRKFIRTGPPPTACKDPKTGQAPPPPSDLDQGIELFTVMSALSGDVYIDESKRIWFQMSPGATIYHYGDEPVVPEAEAIFATAKTQNFIPVFKLVSPDGTGGSLECCIHNPVIARVWLSIGISVDLRASVIGDVHDAVDVSRRIVDDPVLQGSYNYSETIEVGMEAHKMRDIKPHVAETLFYSNPLSRFSPLASRQFPIIDNTGRYLAGQN